MEKMAWDGPKWGQEDLFPTNPDIVDILGRMDFDFDSFCLLDVPDLKIPRSPDLKIPRFLDFQVPTLPFPVRRGPFTNLPI